MLSITQHFVKGYVCFLFFSLLKCKMTRTTLPILALLFLMLHAAGSLHAQKELTISLHDNDSSLPGDIIKSNSFNEYRKRYDWLQSIQFELFKRGYLGFSVDSIIESGKHWSAFAHTGEKYDWAKLSRGNLDGAVLGSVRFRDKIFYQRSMNPRQVSELFESILQHCENNGYPFASVKLDSMKIEGNKVSASLFLNKNQRVEIDSITIQGTSKTHPVYFQNYLGIKPGYLYNESRIASADDRLKELAFVSLAKNTAVLFTDKNTKVQLYVNDRKASRFDGILGLQPNEATGEIGITGDVKLGLQNAFKRGETIMLNWRRLQTATQDIQVKFAYPYLLNTSFGADLGFSLYRRDTSFVQIQGHLGISYLFTGTDYIQLFVEPHQSNVISQSFTPSDGLANSNITLFGLEVQKTQLNYRFNPTRGHHLFMKGSAGNRVIRKNPEIDDSFYEGIELQSAQWNATLFGQLFNEITPRNTVLIQLRGAAIQSSTMFLNEAHRIGGMHTIRGFDEESIFATAYSIFTLEYRFLLEQNSNIFAFFDGAWYELDTRNTYVSDTPFGFGLGISFETAAGIFSLTYALGRQMDNPILLRTGKIHFGFVSFF